MIALGSLVSADGRCDVMCQIMACKSLYVYFFFFFQFWRPFGYINGQMPGDQITQAREYAMLQHLHRVSQNSDVLVSSKYLVCCQEKDLIPVVAVIDPNLDPALVSQHYMSSVGFVKQVLEEICCSQFRRRYRYHACMVSVAVNRHGHAIASHRVEDLQHVSIVFFFFFQCTL